MSDDCAFTSISPDAVSAYEQEGVICLRGLFTSSWLELLAAGIERNLGEPGPFAKRYTPVGAPGLFFGDYCNWRQIPEYAAFLFNSPASEAAGQLMQSQRVNLFHEHVLVKEPGTLERTPWHQDQPYYCVDGAQICSIWLPLDPVPQETCPEFVAGSHRFVDNRDHPTTEPGFRAVPDVDAERSCYRIHSWDLRPGDCIVFHALTLHGAPGNQLSHRRRAFVSRWTGDDARFVLRSGFMSPPPPPDAPSPGSRMDSPAFPVVWPREERRSDAGVA